MAKANGTPIRVAILGQGRSGRDIHGDCLSKLAEYKIVAVCDIDESRRARAIAEYGCEAVADYQSLFGREDIDLIINALPSPLHAPVTLEFLQHGQSVQVEKPAAATAAELDQLVLTANSTNAGLYFFQNSRFLPWFIKTREILDSGILGRPIEYTFRINGFARRWDWQTLQCMNAGGLRNTGPHVMDQAVVLMNNTAMPEIFAHFATVNVWGDANDFAKVIMRVPGGPIFDIEISSCDRFPGPALVLQAEHGGLCATNNTVTYHYYDHKNAPEQKLIRTPLCQADGTPAYCREELNWTEKTIDLKSNVVAIGGAGGQPSDMPVTMLYQKLYAHIREGAPYEITAAQVRQQIAITDECHRLFPLPRL